MNPIFNKMQQGGFNPFANFQNTLQQFNQFRQSFQHDPQQIVQSMFQNGQMSQQQFDQLRQSFQGDPQQIVQNMLQNGQMSQQQFDQLSGMARQFQQMIGR
jgi:hypothetical protein